MDTTRLIRRDYGDNPFINVKHDYGFKYYFGQLRHKHVLIRYLNAIFSRAGRDIVVEDVAYHDKEILPISEDGKKIIYDIYCSTPAHHHFIVEMQNVYEQSFENRIIFYTMKIPAGQGAPGWDYDLEPVFSIILSNFNVRGLPKQLFHDIVLYDKETSTVFSDKINIFLICLPERPGRWKECRDEFERLTYLIDRMGDLTKDSEEYKDIEYSDFFKAAEKSNMSDTEYVRYSESIQRVADQRREMAYARKEAREAGLVEGRAEGRAEERIRLTLEFIKKMLLKKIDIPTISELSGYDISQIEKLASEM